MINVVLYSPSIDSAHLQSGAGTSMYVSTILPLFETYYHEFGAHPSLVNWALPYIHYEESLHRVIHEIIAVNPTVLGIGRYIWNEQTVDRVAKAVKKACPDVIIISGGPHQDVTFSESPFAARQYVDAIVEPGTYGEVFIADLLDQLCTTGSIDWNLVRGAIYNKKSIAFRAKAQFNPREFVWPTSNPYERHKNYFIQVAKMFKDPFVAYETSRGCPYSCSFCEWGINAFQKLSNKPTDIVINELTSLVDVINQFYFTDANYGQTKRDIEILSKLESALQHQKLSPAYLRFAGFAKNKKEHLIALYQLLQNSQHLFWSETKMDIIAVQDFNDSVKHLNSRTDLPLDQLLSFRSELVAMGKNPSAQFIVGLYGQSIETHYNNIKILIDHFEQPDGILFAPLAVLPDTPAANPQLLNKHKAKIRTISVFNVEYQSMVESDTYSFVDYIEMILTYKLLSFLFKHQIKISSIEAFNHLWKQVKPKLFEVYKEAWYQFNNNLVINLTFDSAIDIFSKTIKNN